jgi:hypothetical protein
MRRLLVHPFRFCDPVTGRWRKARYVAEPRGIAARYAPGDFGILGPHEVRNVDPAAAYFTPTASARSGWAIRCTRRASDIDLGPSSTREQTRRITIMGNKSHVVAVMAQSRHGGGRLAVTESARSDIEMLKRELAVTKEVLLNTRLALYQAADELERLLSAVKVPDHNVNPPIDDPIRAL